MDNYDAIRSLPFNTFAPALGADLSKFKRSKEEWVGPCAIHGSKNNTGCFRYHDSGKFHCFSCQAKGRGAIDYAMQLLKIGFQAAVERLGDIKPLPAKKEASEPVSETTEAVLKPLEKDSWRKFSIPCPWLEARVPDPSIRELYGVFCYNNPSRKSAYSNRVMIPVRDIQGSLYGYLGRAVESKDNSPSCQQDIPKYLFPPKLPKSRFLFGANVLKAQHPLPVKVLYLVESPFCVMKFASLGLPAVSPYGWSVSEEQVQTLHHLSKGIVALPDRNKYQEFLSHVGTLAKCLWVRCPPLPDGIEDPELLSLEQIQALTR